MAAPRRIIGIDSNPRKFALARSIGATEWLDPDGDAGTSRLIVELTQGGVDYSFECMGNVDVMGAALACTHKGWGQSIVIGVAGSGEEVRMRPVPVVTGREWRGSAFGGVRGRSELPALRRSLHGGSHQAGSEYVSATMPLADVNRAFEPMHDGAAIRSVLRYR